MILENNFNIQKALFKLKNIYSSFDYIKINLASSLKIKSWAQKILPSGKILGEVTNSELYNDISMKMSLSGLFCETIFGPLKDWKCKCGKYNGFSLNKVCESCYVELSESKIRRYRMGYIDLKYPIVHYWYINNQFNYLHLMLESYNNHIKTSDIKNIIYYSSDEIFFNSCKKLKNINNNNLNYENYNYILNDFNFLNNKKNIEIENLVGTELIKIRLENLNIKNEIKKLRSLIYINSFKSLIYEFYIKSDLLKKIRIFESFLSTKTNPSWMILTILPVLPPNLRPLYELENGQIITAGINNIYQIIIKINKELFNLLKITNINYYNLLFFQHKRNLQEIVDSLIDNGRISEDNSICIKLNDKKIKSLTEILEGKYGRFRQSLLGKRVDFSARSIIVVEPTLRLNQCSLPYDMVNELFKPFLINEIILILNKKIEKIKPQKFLNTIFNIKIIDLIINLNKPLIWKCLNNIIKNYNILLNRAPTLHRFGIQAFNPTMSVNKSISLHPLVCTGFNADFDGDQMAVHLPISDISQVEVENMMQPINNVFSSSYGEIILKPSQDIVIGCYYLTVMTKNKNKILQNIFSNQTQIINSLIQKKINIHTSILLNIKINNIFFYIIKNKLNFFKDINLFYNKYNLLTIYKIYKLNNKFYILTNIGIIIAINIFKNKYKLISLYIETTPGRLIFNINYQSIIKKEYGIY